MQISQGQSTAQLRAATYRISSTPTQQLPHVVPQIAASLANCRDVLAASHESTKSSNETASLVHRLRTTLSSLLQDRTIEGRWAAVILVKTTLEAGGVELLTKSNGWVRSLLAILKKPDPPTTRSFAVITLTRIFTLTWNHSNLVREITTPALPTFLASCLNNVEKKSCGASELQTVLDAFATLIPKHPTIFRTYEAQIRSLLVRILSSIASDSTQGLFYTQSQIQSAQKLFVLLHHCAPKQGASDKWDATLLATTAAAHATCDILFRSVKEDDPRDKTRVAIVDAGEVGSDSIDDIALTAWNGVFNGSKRLITILGLIEAHFQNSTYATVSVRIGAVLDLVRRILSLTTEVRDDSSNFNSAVTKEEREALLATLPSIHVAALHLVCSVLCQLEQYVVPIIQNVLDLVIGVYSAESFDARLREVTYDTMELILGLVGPSMSKDDVAELTIIVNGCCTDLLPQQDSTPASVKGAPSKHQLQSENFNAQNVQSSTMQLSHYNEVRLSAKRLLPTSINKLDPTSVPRKLRTQMERTAVLTGNKGALIACVLNPAKNEAGLSSQISLLPLLARQHPSSSEVEALLRPRVPFNSNGISQRSHDVQDGVVEEDDQEPVHDTELQNGTSHVDRNGVHDIPVSGQMDEDLYSATPPPDPPAPKDAFTQREDSAQSNGHLSTKRTAMPELEDNPVAKRLRIEKEDDDNASSLTEVARKHDKMVDPTEDVPTVEHDATIESDAEAEEPLAAVASSSRNEVVDNANMGNDDSDFEIPPLTMESSDSDLEEEDDDDN